MILISAIELKVYIIVRYNYVILYNRKIMILGLNVYNLHKNKLKDSLIVLINIQYKKILSFLCLKIIRLRLLYIYY